MKERTGRGLLWSTGHHKVGKELEFYSRYDRKPLGEFVVFCFLFVCLFFGWLASILFLSRKVARSDLYVRKATLATVCRLDSKREETEARRHMRVLLP